MRGARGTVRASANELLLHSFAVFVHRGKTGRDAGRCMGQQVPTSSALMLTVVCKMWS